MCAKTRAGARRAAHIRISIGDSCKTVKDSKGTYGPNDDPVPSNAWSIARRPTSGERSVIPIASSRPGCRPGGVRAPIARKPRGTHEKSTRALRCLHLLHRLRRRALHEFAFGVPTVLGGRGGQRGTLRELSTGITTLFGGRDSAAQSANENARDCRSYKTQHGRSNTKARVWLTARFF